MISSRRGFFFGLSSALAAQAAKGDGEDYWALVRRQFPLEEGLTYLNAANVCPASRPVLDRHAELLRDFQANPSFQNRDKYEKLQEGLRLKIATLLHVSANEIAITRNTSEATNTFIQGIDLKSGDEVVLTAHNHPSNLDAWKVRARREGFTLKIIPVAMPAKSKQDLVDGFGKVITAKTKVVSFTHCTSTTGILFPAREIAEVAHKVGAWVHVDGAQTFGAIAVNLRDIGCDSYSGSSHKWMMGPLEAGVLYVKADRIPRLWPAIVSAHWSETLEGARKFEVYGQRDDPRLAAFASAIDFIQMIGMDRTEQRMRHLATYLKTKLVNNSKVEMLTNLEPEVSAGVIRFRLRGHNLTEAYNKLYSRNRIALALTDSGDATGLRLSPHIYNSTADCDVAAEAIKSLG